MIIPFNTKSNIIVYNMLDFPILFTHIKMLNILFFSYNDKKIKFVLDNIYTFQTIFIFIDKYDKYKIPYTFPHSLSKFNPNIHKQYLFYNGIFPEIHTLFWEEKGSKYGGPTHKWILRIYRLKNTNKNTLDNLININIKYNVFSKIDYKLKNSL